MKALLGSLALASLVLVSGAAAAAAAREVVVGASAAIDSAQGDVSPPLRDIAPVPAPAAPSLRELPRQPLPRRRGTRARSVPQLSPDLVLQAVPGMLAMPDPLQSFEGLGNVDGVLPPDPNGAVGPNHYVQWVNLSFAIYDKAGTLLYGPAAGNTLWAGFGGPCETSNDGDPIVLHDHLADRWLMSQLAHPDFPFGPFYQCVAVSRTPDPTGAYHRYAFRISNTKLNDYPKLGIWPDGYYLAVNQFNELTLTYAGQGVAVFEREKMLAGLPAAMVYFDLYAVDPDLGGMLPADVDGAAPPGGTPAYYAQIDDDAWGQAVQDQLQIWRFSVSWGNPSASTFTGPSVLATAPFDSNLCGYDRNCIPQPGTPSKLDAISDRLMYRVQYRNFGTHETLVLNHTVDSGADHAGIRWYEVRDPGGTPFIQQQGTYAPDADHRWMGSIAMDGAGNLALGFSVSSETQSPSIRYAGRLAGDPPGTLPLDEGVLAVGSGSQTDASGRWGDYSSLSVDPVDQCTFWYTQEYYATTSTIGWQTRIGSFKFPSCAVDLPMVTLVATTPSASEAGPVAGVVTASRTGDTAATLTLTYTVGGTAAAGTDYVPLSGSVTIPAGAATATIDVTPIDDALVESDETVILTLTPDPGYAAGTPSTAILIIASDDRPPDLAIAALSVPATAGAGATITVADTTQNQGEGPAAASATTLYLSTNTTLDGADVALGSRTVEPLAAGATSAGSTAVAIPVSTGVGLFYVIARADADGVIAETQESNNTSYKPIRVGPDLVLPALTVPSTGAAGGTLTVSDTTRNQGGGAAAASATRFYLSANTALDGGDVALGSRAVEPLAAGASSTGSTAVTIPPGTGTGLFYVIARADADASVAETQESNNTSYRSVRIGPDLAVSALAAPTAAGAGGTITVSDTTQNQGAGPAPASTTAFYLSTNTSLDGGDVRLGSRPVAVLAGGAASAGSTALTIPPGTGTGVFYLVARADADGAVTETLESNNTRYRQLQIGPDLTIATLAVPSTAGAGAPITVSDTTENQGGGPAAATTTTFHLSTDTKLDAGDRTLGSRAVAALAAGASSPASTVLALPADTGVGLFYVIARADADDTVAETLESNNASYRSLRIGPDLVVAALSAPTTASAGATITVSDTTRNQGGGTAGPSSTTLYLSTNTTLDAGDVVLASRAVATLAASAASTGSTPVTVPSDTPAGRYYLIGAADAGDGVVETLETNNTRYRPLQIGAGS